MRDSGLQVLDSDSLSVELGFWILIVILIGFLELYSKSQSLRFRIPHEKVSRILDSIRKTSQIPESTFPYMGRPVPAVPMVECGHVAQSQRGLLFPAHILPCRHNLNAQTG